MSIGKLLFGISRAKQNVINTSCNSVGKGPSPTRVVYALTTPRTSPIVCGGIPRPVITPPIEQLLLVTYGYVPKSMSNIAALAPSTSTVLPDRKAVCK